MDLSLSNLWERMEDGGAGPAVLHGVTQTQTRLRVEQQQMRPLPQALGLVLSHICPMTLEDEELLRL